MPRKRRLPPSAPGRFCKNGKRNKPFFSLDASSSELSDRIRRGASQGQSSGSCNRESTDTPEERHVQPRPVEEEENSSGSNSNENQNDISLPFADGADDGQEQIENNTIDMSDLSAQTNESSFSIVKYVSKTNKDPTITIDWRSVNSLLLHTGSLRQSKRDYHITRIQSQSHWDGEKWTKVESNLLPETTLRRKVLPFARNHVFGTHVIKMFPVDFNKSGARGGVDMYRSKTHAPISITKPSTWALLDFSCSYMNELVFGSCSALNDPETAKRIPFLSIEDTPIVRDRLQSVSPLHMYTSSGVRLPVRPGTVLGILLQHDLERIVGLKRHGFVLEKDERGPSCVMVGKVAGVNIIGKEESPSALRSSVLKPGDVLLDLVPCPENERSRKRYWCSLVFRCFIDKTFRQKGGRSRVSVLFGKRESRKQEVLPGPPEAVLDKVIRVYACEFDGPETKSYSPSTGYLKDGRPYKVYRFLLYADGFQTHSGKKMDGVYLLPMGVSPNERSFRSVVRKIALCPPGTNSSQVIESITPDIIHGTLKGFPHRDENGNEEVIFLDILGFIGDYPAISELIDVRGHNANTPCHLCMFQKYDASGRNQSNYAYTSENSSMHLSFFRNSTRANNLQCSALDSRMREVLGLKERITKGSESLLPLHKLSEALEKIRDKIPRTLADLPVVPGRFDPYRSCFVAPDHLFFGLIKNVINTVLTLLTPRERKESEIMCKEYLAKYMGDRQSHLFSVEQHELLSMSMSSTYKLILVCPFVFRQYIGESSSRSALRDAIDLADRLRELVCDTQYVADSLLDGEQEYNFFVMQKGATRFALLRRKAMQYLKELSNLCSKDSKAKKYLDKPNTHRLIELYDHTLPCFGNVMHIQELLFEKAHQELKRNVERSNAKNEQLQAMENHLATDWSVRLALEVQVSGRKQREREKGESESQTMRSILRLLGFPDWSELSDKVVADLCGQSIPFHITGILSQVMGGSLSFQGIEKIWKGNRKAHERRHERRHMSSSLEQKVKKMLRDYCKSKLLALSSSGSEPQMTNVPALDWCTRRYNDSAVSDIRTLTIHAGDLLQSVTLRSLKELHGDRSACSQGHRERNVEIDCEDDELIDVEKAPDKVCASGRRTFWVCKEFFEVEHKECCLQVAFALVQPCAANNGGDRGRSFVPLTGHACGSFLLEMDRFVRPVMAMHACYEEHRRDTSLRPCISTDDNGRTVVKHSKGILDGGLYIALGRREGFPPRTA